VSWSLILAMRGSDVRRSLWAFELEQKRLKEKEMERIKSG